MLSKPKYSSLCLLGTEVFYVLCIAYGSLLAGKPRELHHSLFELLPWFAWGNPLSMILGAVLLGLFALIAGWYRVDAQCESSTRHKVNSYKVTNTGEEIIMKKVFTAVVLSAALGLAPVLAQEKKDMPMKGQMPSKESMPMKGEGMQGGGMDMSKMKEMHSEMMEMKKGMGGMVKGQGMMKSEDMKGMGGMMGDMSGMMGDMGHMMESGKMTPEQMSEMSKMMGEMSGMMKQMSERMERGTKKTQ